MQNILITGITGQDGLFLTSKILNQDEKINIYGTSRFSKNDIFFKKLSTLNKKNFSNIKIIKLNLNEYNPLNNLIKDIQPKQIYNLSGPSSVYKSINDSGKTFNQITNIFDHLIKSVNENSLSTKFFQASSSEMFEKNKLGIYNEKSSFNPRTPYSEAKLINHKKVLELSERGEVNIKSGIMFNHESEFRESDYLIMQIINSAKKIKNGEITSFKVGSTELVRDWSFAGDIANAIYEINNFGKSNTYVIGSGIGNKVADLIKNVFHYFDLNYEEYIQIDNKLNRKDNNNKIVCDPERIKQEFSYSPTLNFEELIIRCIEKKFDN